MRYLQYLLLVIGTTSLSSVAGMLAIGASVALFQRPGGEPWTRGFGQYVGGLICGAPLGALVGLVGSICFICSQSESRPWNPFVWIGIVLGLMGGTALSVHWGMVGGNQWWLTVTFIAIAAGAAGGFLTRLTLGIYRIVSKPSSRRR